MNWTIDHDNLKKLMNLVQAIIPSNSYDITIMDGCDYDYGSHDHSRDNDPCDLLSHMHIAGMIDVNANHLNCVDIICDYLVVENHEDGSTDDVTHEAVGQWLDSASGYVNTSKVTLHDVFNKLYYMQNHDMVTGTDGGGVVMSKFDIQPHLTLKYSFNLISVQG